MRVLLCLAPALLVLFLPSALGNRPTGLTQRIEGDKVILSWQYERDGNNPVFRFYITVQEKRWGIPPDYIHVGPDERKAAIVGMKPGANYYLKVIAYVNSGAFEHSDTLLAYTAGLSVLNVRNFKVSAITAKTALFRWEYDSQYIVHLFRLGLFCDGERVYTNRDNVEVKEPSSIKQIFRTGSQGWGAFYIDYLPPNTMFKCDFTKFIWWSNRRNSPTQITFTTSYAAPTPAPTPTISVPQERSELNRTMFTINLFQTDNRYGPISHYKVFAVPVEQTVNQQAATMPFTANVNIKSLISTAVSSELVSQVTEAIPFLIGTYTTLPEHLIVDDIWLADAFKPLSHYAVVVAAFTKAMEGDTHMFSFSALSNPPVYIDEEMHYVAAQVKMTAQGFTSIVLGSLFAVATLFCIAFMAVFINNYIRGKKRDASYFAVDDEDSEDEVFSRNKRKAGNKKTAGNRTPKTTPTPAFQDNVYESPDAAKEDASTSEKPGRKGKAKATEEDPTQGRKKKDKRSTSAGKGEQSSDTPLPSYYYATTNPEPDVCIEEYNVTAGATPHSTQHTVTPTQLKKKSKKSSGYEELDEDAFF